MMTPSIMAQGESWAITDSGLNKIIALDNAQLIEAVATKIGEKLPNSRNITIRNETAIIPIIGTIFRYENIFTNLGLGVSIDSLALDLQKTLDSPTIKSIVLEIDSPGGQIDGVSELADLIGKFNKIKPVTAYLSGTGASAAYWLASAAGAIVAAKTGQIGSIGVIIQAFVDSDNAIKFISSQSPLKNASPTSATGKAEYQQRVDSLANVFIEAVAGFRGVTPAAIQKKYGQGGLLIASAALRAGMIDRIGSLESIISGAKPIQTKQPPSTRNNPGKIMMPTSNHPTTASTPKTEMANPIPNPTFEQALILNWKEKPALRDEFRGNFGAYSAFFRAQKEGRVGRT